VVTGKRRYLIVDKPRRAIEITITVSADTTRDVRSALRAMELNISDRGDELNGCLIAGAPTYSYEINGTHNPEITHDMYFEQLNKSI